MMRRVFAVLLAAACQAPPIAREAGGVRPRPPSAAMTIPAALEEAAAVYRRDKTFAALERVVAELEPGMARADVERLLGEADGWDDPSVYYRGDRVNAARESLGVTLDFYLWYTDGRPTRPSDRIEQWAIGPGNRWEEGDKKLPPREPAPAAEWPADLRAAAEHYRRNRDYASLRRVLRVLHLGTPRQDVERLLGPPDDCRPQGLPCHYRSERQNAAGLPLAITVEYRVHNAEGTALITTDRLEAIVFGPVPR